MVLIYRNVISLVQTIKPSTIISVCSIDDKSSSRQHIHQCYNKFQYRKFVSLLNRSRTTTTNSISNKSATRPCTPIKIMRELTQTFSESVIHRSSDDDPNKSGR